MNAQIQKFRDLSRRVQAAIAALVLAVTGSVPFLVSGTAYASTALLQRQLQATTARPSQAVDLTWQFDTANVAGSADKIEIEFCDSPLGTCNTTKIPTLAASATVTLAGPWTTTATGSVSRVAGDSGGSNNQYEFRKSTVDTVQNKTALTMSFGATDITNNTSANKSYYTRVRIYSDNGTTLVHDGVFAQSTSQTLTVNARVQERLDFCVGATAVNDGDTTTPTPTNGDCTDITGTTVDIGNVESGFTNVSPVTAVNGGSNTNGIAMVRTNAINGVVVDYKAIQDASPSGKLKISTGTCVNNTSTTDPCFNSQGTTAGAFTAGTEKFGMVIAGVNCVSTSAYTCLFSNGTYNLVRDPEYDGAAAPNNSYVADSNQVGAGTSGQYAWDDSGTADRIASSAGSTVKVVDDEALILKFAGTAGVTTPTGSYTVQADFIATTTF